MPLASSKSPTSGDIHLIDAYIRATDEIQEDEPYYHPNSPLRLLLRGTEELFLHLVTDAGFALKAANKSRIHYYGTKNYLCRRRGTFHLYQDISL